MDLNSAASRLGDSLPLFLGREHPCPYLPERTARDEYTLASRVSGAAYQRMMDAGFRRSGGVIYRPACKGCRECVPLRVEVGTFRPSGSQRRVLRRNRDVTVDVGRPMATDEKWGIYRRYLAGQHGKPDEGDRADFEQFLYQSPTSTLEMVYRAAGRIIGAGIVDLCPDVLSSVYFYFDPEAARRSPGVLAALREIEHCRERGLRWWYVGYYVAGCRRMNYKSDYRPYELLGPDGVWHPAAS